MSEALEALSKAEMALSFALSSMSHAQCRDDVKKAQNAHKAIRAALEQPSTAEAQARALEDVAVPVSELKKLEQAREQLYDYLTTVLTEAQMLGLTSITGQIWKVANTKSWKRIREEG